MMNLPPSFELMETHTFRGTYSWRLKDSELRYRGSEAFRDSSLSRIPVTDEQLADFAAALDLLAVWEWRPHYCVIDVGSCVEDGCRWSFKANIKGRTCNVTGGNAFPAFTSPLDTVITPKLGRFGLLLASLRIVFGASIPALDFRDSID